MAKKGSTLVQGTMRPGWLVPAIVVLLLAGLGGVFVGVDALGQVPANTTLGYGGMGALVVAVAIVIALVTTSRREVVVDAKGVELRAPGGKAIRIDWSEPHSIHFRAPDGDGTGGADRVSVRAPDGRRIDVGKVDVPDNPNAAVPRVVERHSTTASWSRIEDALEAGERVAFGPVTLDSETVDVQGTRFPKDSSLCMQIMGGKLRVGSKGKWTSTEVRVEDVGNFPCLLRAIGQVSQARPPG